MSVPRHVVCVGTVVVSDGRCLLVKQAPGSSLEGQWSIPWGFVDDGETLNDAAERETLEEAGLRVRVSGVVAVQTLPRQGGVGLVFAAQPLDDEALRPDGTETSDARFVSEGDLRDLPVEEWCQQLAARALKGELSSLGSVDNPYGLPGWA